MSKNVKTERQLKHYEKLREKGRQHYLIRYGVLGWGLTSGILTILLDVFFWQEQLHLHRAVFLLATFLVAGYFWGGWMWSRMVKKWEPCNATHEDTC